MTFNIITRNTKALITVNKGRYRTRILEFEKESYSTHRPLHILEESCRRFGSTLMGRRRVAEQILGTKSMVPAPIKPLYGLYMFPILSDRNDENVWLAYYAIDMFDVDGKQARVHFTDGTELKVPVSVRVLDNQLKKTAQVIAWMVQQLYYKSDRQ